MSSGYGSGSGDGYGYGYGYGYGHGDGYGYGYGHGDGYGCGYGYGYGDGDGYGYGYGYGAGYGDGYGDGCGYGDEVARYEGHAVRAIVTPWGRWAGVGCQVHTPDEWRARWAEIATAHDVEEPSAGRVAELLALVESAPMGAEWA